MSISASDKGMRPGVCTSSNRPATPYDGQVIYETDTDKIAVWDSSSWVYKTGATAPNSPALIKITSGSLSSTSTTINSVFSSTYDAYKVVLTSLTSTSDGYLYLRFGSAATEYYIAAPLFIYSGGAYNVGYSYSNNSLIRLCNTGYSTKIGMSMDVINPYLSAGTCLYSAAAWGATFGGTVSALLKDTTSYTAFTIAHENGTMSGNYTVYGYSL